MKLSPDQKKYIRTNHGRIPPKAMARQLGIEVKFVRRAMRELGLHVAEEIKAEKRNQRAAQRFLRMEKFTKVLDGFKSPRLAWPLLLFLALGLRLAHLVFFADCPFFNQYQADSALYHAWGVVIAEGDWLGAQFPVFYLGPGYAYFLALHYSLFGVGLWSAIVTQVLLGAVSAGLIYELGRRLFGPATGLMAGLLAACYPMFLFTNALLLGASLVIFLNLLLLLLIASAMPRPTWWKWLLAGLLLGLSALVRGNVLLFGPLAVIAVMAYYGWNNRKRWLSAAALMFCGCLLPIAPVTAHNVLLGGDPAILTTNAGANFYIGNHPEGDGLYLNPVRHKGRPMGMIVRDQQVSFPEVARKETGKPKITPSQVSRFWLGQGLENIKEKPSAWRDVMLNKLTFFFNAYEVPNNYSFDFSKRFSPLLRAPLPGLGLVMPLGLFGLLLMVRRFRKRGLLLMYFAAYFLALMAFFVNGRYRLPLAPVLIICAAVSLRWLWLKLKERRWLALGLAAVSLASLFWVVNRPVREVDFRANLINLGIAYRDLNQPEKALAIFDEGIREMPTNHSAHLLRGRLLAKMGRRKEAIQSLAKALELARKNKDIVAARRVVRALAKVGVKVQIQGEQKTPQGPEKQEKEQGRIHIPAPSETGPRP